MHEGRYLKQIIESQKLKKTDVAQTLGISPQLLQGYFRSERLQDTTKAEIKEKLGIEINSAMHQKVNEPSETYSQKDEIIRSLQKEVDYLKKINEIQTDRIREKDEVITILKKQIDPDEQD